MSNSFFFFFFVLFDWDITNRYSLYWAVVTRAVPSRNPRIDKRQETNLEKPNGNLEKNDSDIKQNVPADEKLVDFQYE